MNDKIVLNATVVAQLDCVLNFFKGDNQSFPCRSTDQILYHLKSSGINVDVHDVDAILIKLKKDEFISDDKELAKGMIYNGIKLNEVKEPIWFLTFEGRALLELDNGYQGKKEKEKRLEERVTKNERSIRRFTRLAGYSTAALLLFEIIKFIISRIDMIDCR